MFADSRSGQFFPFSLLCAVFGTLAFAGYYSDLLKPHVPDWLAVGIYMLPLVIALFIQWGEMSDRIVARAHLFAGILFVLQAGGIELGAALGYRPEGLMLYRILAHLAWSFAWGSILKRAWNRRKQTA